jgi:hypothetical protein
MVCPESFLCRTIWWCRGRDGSASFQGLKPQFKIKGFTAWPENRSRRQDGTRCFIAKASSNPFMPGIRTSLSKVRCKIADNGKCIRPRVAMTHIISGSRNDFCKAVGDATLVVHHNDFRGHKAPCFKSNALFQICISLCRVVTPGCILTVSAPGYFKNSGFDIFAACNQGRQDLQQNIRACNGGSK